VLLPFFPHLDSKIIVRNFPPSKFFKLHLFK